MREALEAVATPEVAGRMLFEALAEARLSALPEQHDDLRSFVELELTQVVQETLGPDAVMVMHERIELVLRVLSRIEQHRQPDAKRPSSRPVRATPRVTERATPQAPLVPRPLPAKGRGDATLELPSDAMAMGRAEAEPKSAPLTRPPPSGAHSLPPVLDPTRTERETRPPPSGSHVLPSTSLSTTRVVLVTADARLGSTLRVHLGATATVLTYRTLTELARSPIGSVQLLLLDVRDLPRDAELSTRAASVLLWPASISDRDRFANKHPHLADVRFAGHDASADDIASVISLTLAR